jgi:hypothetical protein
VRKLALIMLLAVLSFGLVACGGDDEPASGGGSSSGDVDQILQETFSDSSRIESGNLEATISGGEGDQQATLTLSGPFQSQGDKQLPLVAMSGSFSGSGEEFEAGVVNTGEKGYVSFQGENYEVSGPVYEQFKAAYEQAAMQGGEEGQSLSSLGLNPRDWLTDAKIEGDADVGGTETTKITGGVDVAAVVDDVNAALEKMRSLGLDGSDQLPEQITPEQKQQATEAVQDARVEVYSGNDDRILRRMKIDLTAEGQTVTVDITLTGVNEDQEIPEPSDARPFSELAEQLGGLGLGGLGGSGSGGGGGGGANSGGADAQALEEYSQCVQNAAGDSAKTAQCADLLTP